MSRMERRGVEREEEVEGWKRRRWEERGGGGGREEEQEGGEKERAKTTRDGLSRTGARCLLDCSAISSGPAGQWTRSPPLSGLLITWHVEGWMDVAHAGYSLHSTTEEMPFPALWGYYEVRHMMKHDCWLCTVATTAWIGSLDTWDQIDQDELVRQDYFNFNRVEGGAEKTILYPKSSLVVFKRYASGSAGRTHTHTHTQ